MEATQMERIDERQVKNAAGGYVYELDVWGRLDRFLILGSEDATYYAGQDEMTASGEATLTAALSADGERLVRRAVQISEAGRAPKNTPAIKAIAWAAARGDAPTRKAALAAMPLVCRTGTHLFTFCQQVTAMRGWGRGLREAVGEWYTDKSPLDAAYQVAKYRQRGGWSHRDTLRLSHPVPPTPAHRALFRWAVGKPVAADLPKWAGLVDLLAAARTKDEVIRLVSEYSVPWEFVPTAWLGERDVWAALLPHMPLGAMVRNLGRMGANGLLAPFSDAVRLVCRKVEDGAAVSKARLHPIALLSAQQVYAQGHGQRGGLTWTPVQQVVDALDVAFYASFGTVEPSASGNVLLAVDVSGSMTGGDIAGVPGLTPNVCAAAMALVTASVEPSYHILGFADDLRDLGISPRMRLAEATRRTQDRSFGATDCAQPVLWALKTGTPVHKFVIYTDEETFAGPVHVSRALAQYREKTGIPASLILVAMTATKGTLNCPDDPRALDVVGFDTATPDLISQF